MFILLMLISNNNNNKYVMFKFITGVNSRPNQYRFFLHVFNNQKENIIQSIDNFM